MKVIILVGGRSTEHDASLHSYAYVLDAILKRPDELTLEAVVYIDRSGGFHVTRHAPWPIGTQELSEPALAPAGEVLYQIAGSYCFSLLHGNEGEDGAWQGVAEIFGLHGSFGSILASAMSMNKRMQSLVVRQLVPELSVPPTWALRSGTPLGEVVKELAGRPIVVKPNQMGASLLTKRLTDYDEGVLAAVVSEIFRYDTGALVQEYIAGAEYSCGVIEQGGKALALPVMRIETQGAFFGHQQKHQRGRARSSVVSASGTVQALQRYSERLFTELDLLGWARFDYIISPAGSYFLEINSIPGLMSGSLFPRMLDAAGLGIVELIQLTAEAAGRRAAREKHFPYAIEH